MFIWIGNIFGEIICSVLEIWQNKKSSEYFHWCVSILCFLAFEIWVPIILEWCRSRKSPYYLILIPSCYLYLTILSPLIIHVLFWTTSLLEGAAIWGTDLLWKGVFGGITFVGTSFGKNGRLTPTATAFLSCAINFNFFWSSLILLFWNQLKLCCEFSWVLKSEFPLILKFLRFSVQFVFINLVWVQWNDLWTSD